MYDDLNYSDSYIYKTNRKMMLFRKSRLTPPGVFDDAFHSDLFLLKIYLSLWNVFYFLDF